jgi:ABC-type glutathione transport system ATPase component
MPNFYKNLTTELTELTEDTEGRSGSNQRADSAEFLEGHLQACLQMDSQKSATIRNPNDSRSSECQTGLVEKSAEIGEICGKNADGRDPKGLRDGEFWAVQDVIFELRRGECLGLIGHNGALPDLLAVAG